MQARMKNPAMIMTDAMQPLLNLWASAEKSGVPVETLELVHIRISQINGCGPCVLGGTRKAKKAGETDDRLFSIAAWREAPFYTEAERAALALAESVTRLSDREDPVPDSVWNEAASHFDEKSLAGLVIGISAVNVWNRLNVSTRQVAGAW